MKTPITDKLTGLTLAQRNAIPDTYGIPVNDPSTLRQHIVREKEPSVYDLDYASATRELQTALNIGLISYGSGIACWRIPQIIKSSSSTNRLAQLWQLYCSEVLNQHDVRVINRTWWTYTNNQQATINHELTQYLIDCAEYLRDNFQ